MKVTSSVLTLAAGIAIGVGAAGVGSALLNNNAQAFVHPTPLRHMRGMHMHHMRHHGHMRHMRHGRRKPPIVIAMHHLMMARRDLARSKHMFNGHRAAAEKLTTRALNQIKDGLKYAHAHHHGMRRGR